jgi:hypothetical protein
VPASTHGARRHGRLPAATGVAILHVLVPAAAAASAVLLQHAAVVLLELPAAVGGLHSLFPASSGRRWRWGVRLPGAAAAQPHPAVVPMVLQDAAVVRGGHVGERESYCSWLGCRASCCPADHGLAAGS